MSRATKLAKVYMCDRESHYKDLSGERNAQRKVEAMILDKQHEGQIKPTESMSMLVDYVKDRLIPDHIVSIPQPLLDVCSLPRQVFPPMPVNEVFRCTAAAIDTAAVPPHGTQFFRVVDPRPENKFTVNVGHVSKPSLFVV